MKFIKVMKSIGILAYILIMLAALTIDGLFVYFKYLDPNITVGVNYISDQLGLDVIAQEDMTEDQKSEYEERWFMEANYYSNDVSNGIEVQELNLNYFTDWTLTSDKYRSTGMQYVGGDYESVNVKGDATMARQYVSPDLYYYDTTNGISWSGGNLLTLLNRDQLFIIKIDGRAYSIQLTGIEREKFLGFLWEVDKLAYTYNDVFQDVFDAIQSNNKGFGSYYITADLSKYFSIREYDMETGEFKADDVTDIIESYSVLKFNYYENGLLNADQSMFGSVALNSKYGLEDEPNSEYWQERIVYTLTKDDLNLRYSELYDGNFASLNETTKTTLKALDRTLVDIVIDIDAGEIIGFDYNAFKGLPLNQIILTSDNACVFYLLENSLWGTDLNVLKLTGSISLNEVGIIRDFELVMEVI